MPNYAAIHMLAGVMLLCSLSTLAQDNKKQAMAACLDKQASTESMVAGCNWLLESNETLSRPLKFEAYLGRAVGRNRLGEYALAVEDIGQAIEISPDNSRLHQFLGANYLQLGNDPKAARALTKAIKLDKNNAQAYFYRGFSYSRLKKHNKAIADFDQAIEMRADFLDAINSRGRSYLNMGDCEKAVIDFNTSLALEPDSGLTLADRAECHYEMGNLEGALADHRRSIEVMADNADVLNSSCWTKGLLGDGAGALVDCNEALRLEPGVAAFYDSRALAYYRLQEYDLALADAMEAMKEPTWENYILRAAIYQRQGQVDLAQVDYRKAKRLQRDRSMLEQRVRLLGWQSGRFPK
jgi:tetratricopeptide (TPR) repeat protein